MHPSFPSYDSFDLGTPNRKFFGNFSYAKFSRHRSNHHDISGGKFAGTVLLAFGVCPMHQFIRHIFFAGCPSQVTWVYTMSIPAIMRRVMIFRRRKAMRLFTHKSTHRSSPLAFKRNPRSFFFTRSAVRPSYTVIARVCESLIEKFTSITSRHNTLLSVAIAKKSGIMLHAHTFSNSIGGFTTVNAAFHVACPNYLSFLDSTITRAKQYVYAS